MKFQIKTLGILNLTKLLRGIPEDFSTRQFKDRVDFILKTMVKQKLARGLSPVEGYRNLAKYKNPKKYPAKLKQSNKPNLYLTGAMLRQYVSKEVPNQKAVTVGVHSTAPKIEQIKAKVHNEGTKYIKQRKFVPSEGENFTRDVTNALKKAVAEVLGVIIRQKQKGK